MRPSNEQPTPDSDSLLEAIDSRDSKARQDLFVRLYDQLRAIASNRLRSSGQSLHTTELVHEAFLKINDASSVAIECHSHFCALAAKTMRQILVDRARSKNRLKRGGNLEKLPLVEADVVMLDGEVDVLSLDEALTELGRFDERLARVVELRSFGGLSVEETAALLEVSPRTVKANWRTARAWLRRFLSPPSQSVAS